MLVGEVVLDTLALLEVAAMASQSCSGVSISAALMPRSTPAKNGSPNTRSWDSETTSATESVRW